jgi:N4-gp56 family major capsid protein
MADITIKTNTSGLTSDRYSEFFNKKLLHHAIQQTRLDEVASKFDLPANVGSTTLRMFKRSAAAASTVETQTEGTPTTNFTNSTITPIDITLAEYGEKVKISNTRRLTDLINQVTLETERLGEAAALKIDELIRDAVISEISYNSSTAITSSGWNLFVGGNVKDAATEAQIETEWDSWKSGSTSSLKMKVADIRRAVTNLRIKRAMPFEGGYYVGVLSQEQIHDLQDDTQWNAVNVYQGSGEKIYKGEIGKIAGCKIIDTTVGFKQLSSAASFGTYSSTGDVYTALIFGKEAVGCMKLAGATSPMKPKFIVNDQPDKTDPLNQYITAGWIGYFAAKCLDKNWVAAIHSKSTLNG